MYFSWINSMNSYQRLSMPTNNESAIYMYTKWAVSQENRSEDLCCCHYQKKESSFWKCHFQNGILDLLYLTYKGQRSWGPKSVKKFDLWHLTLIGQRGRAQNAILKIAFINGCLFRPNKPSFGMTTTKIFTPVFVWHGLSVFIQNVFNKDWNNHLVM